MAVVGREESRLELFVRHLPGVVWTTDRELVITEAVGRGLAVAGLDGEALVGVALADLLEASAKMVEAHEAALRGESGDYRVSYRGRVWDVRVEPVRTADDGVVGTVGSASDVTELTALEQKFEQLVEHAPDVVARFDRGLRHLYVNPAISALTGRRPEELLGRRHRDLGVPADLCGLWERELRAVFDGETPRRFEFALGGAERAHRWFETQLVPERGDSGRVETVLSFTRDRTEAHGAERRRLASERRYRELFEAAGELIVLLAPDGSIADLNPAVTRRLGYDHEELVGRPLGSIVAPEEYPALERQLSGMLEDVEADGTREVTLLTKSGERVPIEVSSRIATQEGRACGVLVVGRDLSETRLARLALEKSERRFRSAFDDAAVGMTLVDPDGLFLRVNPVFAEMLGYRPDELAGMHVRDITHPDDIAASERELAALHAGERDRVIVDKRYLRKDGETVWAHVGAAAVRDDDGRFVCSVSQSEDVTELRRLEEELRQAQKMEAVGRLAGGIAHDFNNLLLAIRGHGELALDRAAHVDQPLADDIEQILAAADRAAALTRQLLTFSRKHVVQPEILDLRTTVADMAKLLERLIGEHIELVTGLPDEPVHVLADATQIEQVIANLAVNARDAMPGGGHLAIELARCGDDAQLTVSDDGDGIDSNNLGHVFEPFFTTKSEGTGLGLATVHGIVTQNGGTITASSAPGQGTTFTIALPLVPAAREAETQTDRERPAPGSETILLVEDDPSVRTVIGHMLEQHGYRVIPVENGDAAIRAATAHAIQLVVTDLVMRGINGRETAEAILRDRPATRILFMSGYTDDETIKLGRFRPGVAFIQKPFTGRTLARTVRQLLDSPAPGLDGTRDGSIAGTIPAYGERTPLAQKRHV